MSTGSKQQLLEECENLWKQIQQSCDENDKDGNCPALRQPEDKLEDGVTAGILRAKVQRLESEIKDLSVTKPTILPHSSEIQYEILEEELTRSISQLSGVLVLISSQKEEMLEEQKREEKYGSELKNVIAALQEAYDKMLTEDSTPDKKKVYVQELERKVTKAEDYYNKLSEKFAKFVDEHFPLPTEKVFTEVKKKLRSADRKMTLADTLPLKVILKDLMKNCLKDPSAYTQIDHRFWPPYVELLLRCQIVQRHPTDERMLKLIPFHL
ncbi:hypothetical protein ScPMuIL_009418 [Solemya velum]